MRLLWEWQRQQQELEQKACLGRYVPVQPGYEAPKTETYEFSPGRLYWREFRELVVKQRFLGRQIELWESSGWLWRDFVVKGDKDAVEAVRKRVEKPPRRLMELY